MNLLWLFLEFLKIGLFTFGGGYAMISIIENECVDKKQWIDSDDLCEYYALSQSLPGVIAISTATFVGYKLKGQLGAFAATFGVVLPAFIAIILLATLFQEIVNIEFIKLNSLFVSEIIYREFKYNCKTLYVF